MSTFENRDASQELDFDTSSSEVARFIADRSFAYGTLAACLQYPDEILVESINSGDLQKGLQGMLDLENDLSLDADDIAGLAAEIDFDTLQTEYTRLFEVTTPHGAACSLYAGIHYGNRMQVMEEHIRFYNFFGLHMPDKIEELPDHLCIELEFLRFLSTQEAYATEKDQEVLSFQKAQRDFMSRHMIRWLDHLESSVASCATESFYRSIVRLVRAVVSSEFKRLDKVQDSSQIHNIAVS